MLTLSQIIKKARSLGTKKQAQVSLALALEDLMDGYVPVSDITKIDQARHAGYAINLGDESPDDMDRRLGF
jgi:hypothetical protein